MNKAMKKGLMPSMLIVLLILFLLSTGIVLAGQNQKTNEEAMALHHLQMAYLNHGLAMAVSGSNVAMLAELSRTPEVDPVLEKHGMSALQRGQELIQRGMTGPEMKKLHKRYRQKESPQTMTYVHSLGKAMLAYVELLGNMDAPRPLEPEHIRALHHMHMGLNHALGSAVQGSNLILLGEMGMEPTEDIEDIKDGKLMIANARTLWTYLLEGPPMKQLMQIVLIKEERTEETEVMARTHSIGKAGEKILNLFASRPHD